MTRSTPGKSLWEYILLFVGGFATLVQVLGLISQSQAFFAQPTITVTAVVIVLIGTAFGCIFALIRRKPGTFTAKVPYYTGRQRAVAGGLLGTNLIVSLSVLGLVIWRPCLTSQQPIPPEKFGILVANFTEGLNRSPTLKGVELARRTLNALNGRLATSSLADKVEVREICAITNEAEARKAGQSANASLVLWGNAAEFAQDTFEPSFTFVGPLLWPSDVNPLIFEVELNRVDSIELPSKISARATSVAAFVIGLIYLRAAENTQDYNIALQEFSDAIDNTELELTGLAKGSAQESAVKRTLAIFYVMRGRGHVGLNDTQRALRDYSTAESYDPYYPSIYVARGNYYYGLRDFSQAESQYRDAISRRPSASAYYGLGNALFYLKHYDESRDAYLKAISLIEARAEDPSGVQIVLGVVYNLTGDPQLALEQWNRVMQSTRASQFQKEQAKKLTASILNPTPSPTLASSTPTIVATETETATPSPVSLLVMTLIITSDTPTQSPTKSLGAGTPFPTLVPTFTSTLPGSQFPTATPTILIGTRFPTSTKLPTATPFPTLFPTWVPTATQTPTRLPTETLFPTPLPSPASTPTDFPEPALSPTSTSTSTPTPTPTLTALP